MSRATERGVRRASGLLLALGTALALAGCEARPVQMIEPAPELAPAEAAPKAPAPSQPAEDKTAGKGQGCCGAAGCDGPKPGGGCGCGNRMPGCGG